MVRLPSKCWQVNLQGKRPLGRPRSRSEGNITIDLKENCDSTRNWIDLTQGKGLLQYDIDPSDSIRRGLGNDNILWFVIKFCDLIVHWELGPIS